MTLYFHVFCVILINRGMYHLDLPFVLFANKNRMLSGTYQLHLSFAFLPNSVHLHAKMSIFPTTVFKFPNREIRMAQS